MVVTLLLIILNSPEFQGFGHLPCVNHFTLPSNKSIIPGDIWGSWCRSQCCRRRRTRFSNYFSGLLILPHFLYIRLYGRDSLIGVHYFIKLFSFYWYGIGETLDFLNNDENVEKPLEEDPLQDVFEDVPQNEDGDIGGGENPIPENDVIETEAEEETETNTIIGNMIIFHITRNI